MRKILLGLTGSVATVLAPKLISALNNLGETSVVVTESAKRFLQSFVKEKARQCCRDKEAFQSMEFYSWCSRLNRGPVKTPVYQDEDEWTWKNRDIWQKDDPVLHIELRKNHGVLVIAPLSIATLGKMANGICDNLLTSTYMAWDRITRPIIVAPAANTMMWEHPATERNIMRIKSYGVIVVPPISKVLACGDEGTGAMANIQDIVKAVEEQLQWHFPLGYCSGIPINHHPGAFGFKRKHSHHTGIDLYTNDGSSVYAVESGRIVGVEKFTGPDDGSPWWNNTDAVLVEGPSGVICYGEIEPNPGMTPGRVVGRGSVVGKVKRVLLEGKERPDIPGHSTSMLHLELYPYETKECSKSWKLGDKRPDTLLDPTPYLCSAYHPSNAILKRLTY